MDLLPNVFVEFDEPPEVSEEAHEVKEAQDQEAHEVSKEHSKAHEDIFEPPAPVPKKKREATEKQKAHLKIIREKALARKREIQEEKRLEKAVKAHEDEEKRLKKNHYTRAEVDALVNQRFTEYQDKHKQEHMRQQDKHMLQQQQEQDKHMRQQDKHMHHRKKWDTWI